MPAALQARIGTSVGGVTALPAPNVSVACATAQPPCAWSPAPGGGLYYHSRGGAAAAPAVGDLRVRWEASDVAAVSFVAVQTRDASGEATLAPYTARSGHTCFLLAAGQVPASALLAEAQARNVAATWTLRALGCLFNYLGLAALAQPAAVALDAVPLLGPFLGDLVQFGARIAAALLSLAVCAFAIAVAWLAARPAVGVPMLLLACAAAAALVAARERQRRQLNGGAPADVVAAGYSAELT